MKRIKTVYFRVAGSGGTGTAITIPAYTELETDENGNYIEGASGTKYKKRQVQENAVHTLGFIRCGDPALRVCRGVGAGHKLCAKYHIWIKLLSSIFYPISLRKTASTWKSAGTSCGCCGRRSACITASLLIPITTTCICSSCGRRYRRLGMAPPSGLTSTVLKISCALIWYEHLEIFMQIKSCVSVQSSYDRSVA